MFPSPPPPPPPPHRVYAHIHDALKRAHAPPSVYGRCRREGVSRHPPPPTIRGDYPPTRFFVGAQLPTETDQYIVRRVVPRNSGPSRPARFRRDSELFLGDVAFGGGRVAKWYGEKEGKKSPRKIVEEKIIVIIMTRRIIYYNDIIRDPALSARCVRRMHTTQSSYARASNP